MKTKYLPLAVLLAGFVLFAAGCGSSKGNTCKDPDGDGYNTPSSNCPNGTDCAPNNPRVHPGVAQERCGPNGNGNGIDDNCSRGEIECTGNANNGGNNSGGCRDIDGDGFDGKTSTCPNGKDCNDNDREINPEATDICGNGKDENCDGEKKKCTQNCQDEDGDGYGVENANQGCTNPQPDCNDEDKNIHPGATETCNGKDDNCNGQTDECQLQNASCQGNPPHCKTGLGQRCNSDKNCPAGMRCDPNSTPRKCRQKEGQPCQADSDCLSGFACSGDKCSGNFCDVTNCTGAASFCDSEANQCVECPHWTENGDDDCPGTEICTEQGWCAASTTIDHSDPVEGHSEVSNDVYVVSLSIADCWLNNHGDGELDLCTAFLVADNIAGQIREDQVESAFRDGNLDFLSQARRDALDDLWGVGTFDAKQVDWQANIRPGSFLNECIWYEPGTVKNEIIVGKCEDYNAE